MGPLINRHSLPKSIPLFTLYIAPSARAFFHGHAVMPQIPEERVCATNFGIHSRVLSFTPQYLKEPLFLNFLILTLFVAGKPIARR